MEDILDHDNRVEVLKKEFLLKYSRYSGLIPLVGGWTIFFLWLVAWSLESEHSIKFAAAGLYWILFSIVIAGAGLLSIIAYTIINKENLHTSIWYALGLILINIPCVFLIIHLVFELGGP